jgi:hypothetical protein
LTSGQQIELVAKLINKLPDEEEGAPARDLLVAMKARSETVHPVALQIEEALGSSRSTISSNSSSYSGTESSNAAWWGLVILGFLALLFWLYLSSG